MRQIHQPNKLDTPTTRRAVLKDGTALAAFALTLAAGVSLPETAASADTAPTDHSGFRTAERLRGRKWEACAFMALKKGDVFQLYEPDGQLVDAGTVHQVAVATSDAYWVKDKCPYPGIQCETGKDSSFTRA